MLPLRSKGADLDEIRKLLIVLMIAIAGLAGPVRAEDFRACVTHMADENLAIKTNYQSGLRDLIVAERPDLTELANLNRDLQVAMAQSRRDRMVCLLESDPKRIVTDKGLSRFSNFDWSDADTTRLVTGNAAQEQLLARIEVLKARNNGHPQWGELRSFIHKQLVKTPEFEAVTSTARAGWAKLEAKLQACPRHK